MIQIGTAIKRYGEEGCFLKHIITLNSCSDINGSVVEAYDNERDVLLAWTKFIQNLDPMLLPAAISLVLILHLCGIVLRN